MLRAEMVPIVRESWPEARAVYLVRDPRDVFASQRRKFGSRRPLASAIYWTLHVDWMERLERENPERNLVLRYEDLVVQPEERLSGILSFLDLAPERAPEMLEVEAASAKSVGQWRERLEPNEVEAIEGVCFEAMQRYGYELEIAQSQVELSSWRRGYEAFRENAHQIPLNPTEWRRKGLFRRFWLSMRG